MNARKQQPVIEKIASAPILCAIETFLSDMSTLSYNDPLEYFRKNLQYEMLDLIVKFLFCLTATSVPSENLKVVLEKRASILKTSKIKINFRKFSKMKINFRKILKVKIDF